jgi:hypothetical protein
MHAASLLAARTLAVLDSIDAEPEGKAPTCWATPATNQVEQNVPLHVVHAAYDFVSQLVAALMIPPQNNTEPSLRFINPKDIGHSKAKKTFLKPADADDLVKFWRTYNITCIKADITGTTHEKMTVDGITYGSCELEREFAQATNCFVVGHLPSVARDPIRAYGIVRYFFTHEILYDGKFEQHLAYVSWCNTMPVANVPGLHSMTEESYFRVHWVFVSKILNKVARLKRAGVVYYLEPHALPL